MQVIQRKKTYCDIKINVAKERCDQAHICGLKYYLFGVKIYGSPWVPWFNNLAFMRQRGKELKEKWINIPEDTDILMTHGPGIYHGDLSNQYDEGLKSNYVGDVELMKRILSVKPKYHVFGHNHEGYGVTMHKGFDTIFVNASTLDRDYKVRNKPIMFYVKGKR